MTRRLPLFGERTAVASRSEDPAHPDGPPILAARPILAVKAGDDADATPFLASLVRGLTASGRGGFVIAAGAPPGGRPVAAEVRASAIMATAADARQLAARLEEHSEALAVVVGDGGRWVRPSLSVLVVRPGRVTRRAGEADLVVGAPAAGVAQALARALAPVLEPPFPSTRGPSLRDSS